MNNQLQPFNILLADDDQDDRYFFDLALKELPYKTTLTTAYDGEKLMAYLENDTDIVPDVLFLDLNMPRKNGAECLLQLQLNPKLRDLPVIIYSTSLHENIADLLYKNGAYYYMLKRDFQELVKVLGYVFDLMTEGKFDRPARDKFILSFPAKYAA